MSKRKGIIITHPGCAHFDDLFATSLVLYKCASDNRYNEIKEIRRKTPNQQELKNSKIWKLDIGGKFNPELRQFDHHLPFDTSEEIKGNQENLLEECAFSMLLKEWGIWEKAAELFPWLDVSRTMDVKGPKCVVKELDISFSALGGLESFIERSILTLFQRQDIIKVSDPLFSILQFIGENFFNSVSDYYGTLKQVKKLATFKTINDVPVIKYPIDAQRSEMLTKVLKDVKDKKWGIGGIAIYPNNRPEGSIALMRYEDDNRVDFTRIANYEHVIFAHSTGFFVAIDAKISERELHKYLEDAIN